MTKVTLITVAMFLLINVMVCDLRFAFSFWRHGARAPDRNVDEKGIDFLGEQWNAPGELTPSGMRMHYLLGRRNRARWTGFLSDSYDNKELYVRSTEYNRTMMSVMSNLQGLFPPGNGPTLTAGQQTKAVPPVTSSLFTGEKASLAGNALPNGITVIPVHLMGPDGDYFFYYNPYKCGPIKDIFASNTQLKVNKDILTKIKTNWSSKLKVALDIKDDTFFDNFGNMYLIADSFVGAYTDDRVLKKFTDAGIDLDDFLEAAHEFEFHNIFYFYNGDANNFFSRIVMTPFLQETFRWMDTRIAYDVAGTEYTGYAAPKVVLYSGHDVTLGAAQTVLKAAFPDDIKELYPTPFASSFIWELYRPDVGDKTKFTSADYTVKITYNDNTTYLEKSFAEFKNKLTPFILTSDDLNDSCGWNQTTPVNPDVEDPVPTSYIDATIVLSVLLFLAVIGLIVLLILLLKKNKTAQGFPIENKVVTTV